MSNISTITTGFFPKAQDGFTTTLAATASYNAATLSLNSAGNYTNGDTIVLILEPTLTTKNVVTGQIVTTSSPVTVINCTWTEGGNNAHNTGAAVYDYVTATHLNLISKGMSIQHNLNGTHGAVSAVSLQASNGLNITGGTVSLPAGSLSATAISGTISTALLTNPYKFRVYPSTTQTAAASGYTTLTFDTRDFDTSNNVDITTNKGRFTAPVAGFYHFDARAALTTSGTNIYQIALNKNGTQVASGMTLISVTSYNQDYTVSETLQLTAGDYIEVSILNGGGSTPVSSGVNGTSFSGFLVSTT